MIRAAEHIGHLTYSWATSAGTIEPVTTSLIGRSAEFQTLETMLTSVVTGGGEIAFIEGEPGIGKTALLEAVTESADELGFTVFGGRAEELEADRPFRSIAQALDVSRAGDERRSEIKRLLTDPGSEGAFYQLIDALEDLVEAEALRAPVLLTIDDLQWADPGTLRTLGSTFRRMGAFPVAMVAALRSAPRNEDLTSLLRATSPKGVRIALQRLDGTAITDIVKERLGSARTEIERTHRGGWGKPLLHFGIARRDGGGIIHPNRRSNRGD